MLITAAIYQKAAWPLLRLQITHILSGFLIYSILFKAIPAVLKLNLVTGTVLRETANDRLGLWSQAIALIKEFPIFGVGPMQFCLV